MPQGSGANPDEVEGNLGIVLCIFLISCCMVYGVFFAIEHPINSYVWKLPFFKWLIALSALNVGIYVVEFDACAYGARPPRLQALRWRREEQEGISAHHEQPLAGWTTTEVCRSSSTPP